MQTTKRQHALGVISRLQDEPWRYRFTQLLTVLLRELRREGVTYDRAFRDVLRFQNSLSLSFPASEVCAVTVDLKAPAPHGDGGIKRIHLTPAFIGLLGANGTLPLHDTERIAMRYAMDRDGSEHELIDVFSNRVIGLYFEAWSKYRLEHSIAARGQDRLLPMLTALAGASERSGAAGVSDATRASHAALLRTRPVAAGTIGRILTEHFGVPIQLEQLVGAWDPIPENHRSTLGGSAPVLGYGAVLGVRLWRHDLRARLRIGPLNEAQLADFLPGGRALGALADMMRLFAVPMIRYEILRLLTPACIKRMQLSTGGESRQLGWNTFLTATPGVAQRPEIGSLLKLEPAAPDIHPAQRERR
jgi:type VI secretion system protein ImpH